MAIGISNGETVQVTLKAPAHYTTGTPSNSGPASPSASLTSQQTVKEFTGVVQNVDSTTGIIQIRGSVTVGSSSVSVDLFVPLTNIVSLIRLV